MTYKPLSEFPYPNYIETCKKVMENSYCPYSNFRVSAILIAEDGRTFNGVNVENCSYGLTMCAERTAIVSAVAAGCCKFKSIIVMTSARKLIGPCGACRQVLSEFGNDLDIYLISEKPDINHFLKINLNHLLPFPFSPTTLVEYGLSMNSRGELTIPLLPSPDDHFD